MTDTVTRRPGEDRGDPNPVELSGLVVTSSHYHALAWMPDVQRQAELLRHLNTNLSKEVGRLVDWSHRLWARRYDPIVVSDEERAQLARLRYLLSNGVKEALVEKVHEWPGVHCGDALRTGEPLKGYWFNRTKEYAARRRGKEYGVYDFAEEVQLAFEKLPCWKHLSDEEYRARIAEMIEDIETQYAREREASGRAVLGVRAIRKVHPHQRPNKTKRSPRPPFHAATKQKLRELREAFNAFLVAFYDAVGKLRDGDPDPPPSLRGASGLRCCTWRRRGGRSPSLPGVLPTNPQIPSLHQLLAMIAAEAGAEVRLLRAPGAVAEPPSAVFGPESGPPRPSSPA